MEITPIAFYRCPLEGKFGLPRQSGIALSLEGRIVFEPAFRNPDALRGMDGFSHLWLIWEFSEAVREGDTFRPTVRPPRLGGNERMGVFATRSPFRPNPLGLSCVRILGIETTPEEGTVIRVSGADLMDGTPIYDIKPYIPYADSFPEAKEGFTSRKWETLEVVFPDTLSSIFGSGDISAITEILSQDPRPRYHDDPERTYGIIYKGHDVKFRVKDGIVEVTEIKKIQ